MSEMSNISKLFIEKLDLIYTKLKNSLSKETKRNSLGEIYNMIIISSHEIRRLKTYLIQQMKSQLLKKRIKMWFHMILLSSFSKKLKDFSLNK